MKKQDFVRAIKTYTGDSSVYDTIEELNNPIGNPPPLKSIELSNWYKGLAQSDKENVAKAMTEAVNTALFGVLCVLDNVRIIDDYSPEERGKFELFYKTRQDKTIRINNPGDDDELHNIFNAL